MSIRGINPSEAEVITLLNPQGAEKIIQQPKVSLTSVDKVTLSTKTATQGSGSFGNLGDAFGDAFAKIKTAVTGKKGKKKAAAQIKPQTFTMQTSAQTEAKPQAKVQPQQLTTEQKAANVQAHQNLKEYQNNARAELNKGGKKAIEREIAAHEPSKVINEANEKAWQAEHADIIQARREARQAKKAAEREVRKTKQEALALEKKIKAEKQATTSTGKKSVNSLRNQADDAGRITKNTGISTKHAGKKVKISKTGINKKVKLPKKGAANAADDAAKAAAKSGIWNSIKTGIKKHKVLAAFAALATIATGIYLHNKHKDTVDEQEQQVA